MRFCSVDVEESPDDAGDLAVRVAEHVAGEQHLQGLAVPVAQREFVMLQTGLREQRRVLLLEDFGHRARPQLGRGSPKQFRLCDPQHFAEQGVAAEVTPGRILVVDRQRHRVEQAVLERQRAQFGLLCPLLRQLQTAMLVLPHQVEQAEAPQQEGQPAGAQPARLGQGGFEDRGPVDLADDEPVAPGNLPHHADDRLAAVVLAGQHPSDLGLATQHPGARQTGRRQRQPAVALGMLPAGFVEVHHGVAIAPENHGFGAGIR